MLIGLTGYAQSGKDTTGAHLAEEYQFHPMSFASKLKSLALTLDPILYEGVTGPTRLARYVKEWGWEDAKRIPEVRRFLQVLGTEGVREHFGPDTWVNALFAEADPLLERGESVVITDVRFPNEAEAVRERGGQLIKLVRVNADGSDFDNGVGKDHPSEASIDRIEADADVRAATVEALRDGVDIALAALASDTIFEWLNAIGVVGVSEDG